MLPKLRLEGDVVSNCVAEVPVPVRDIEICAGEPFVLSVMEVDTPETLNPDPLTFTCENVNVALPEFFSVITSELLLPTTTLPKETLVGLAEPNACRPVPLKLIVAADPGALLVIEMFPAKLPSDVGANVTEKIALAPALMLSGASVIE
jgi:hypothetical protein